MPSENARLLILAESKREFTELLVGTILQPLMAGFLSLYASAEQICMDENKPLSSAPKIFQQIIRELVPKWQPRRIADAYERIMELCQCPYLQELITCTIVVYTKVLSSMKGMTHRNSNIIDLQIPTGPVFIHRCYIKGGELLWQHASLFYAPSNLAPIRRQEKLTEIEQYVRLGIEAAIRASVPVRQIVTAYYKNNFVDDLMTSPAKRGPADVSDDLDLDELDDVDEAQVRITGGQHATMPATSIAVSGNANAVTLFDDVSQFSDYGEMTLRRSAIENELQQTLASAVSAVKQESDYAPSKHARADETNDRDRPSNHDHSNDHEYESEPHAKRKRYYASGGGEPEPRSEPERQKEPEYEIKPQSSASKGDMNEPSQKDAQGQEHERHQAQDEARRPDKYDAERQVAAGQPTDVDVSNYGHGYGDNRRPYPDKGDREKREQHGHDLERARDHEQRNHNQERSGIEMDSRIVEGNHRSLSDDSNAIANTMAGSGKQVASKEREKPSLRDLAEYDPSLSSERSQLLQAALEEANTSSKAKSGDGMFL